MKSERHFRKILQFLSHFFVFFLIVAFITTCSILLFASMLAESLGIIFNQNNLEIAAKLTFLNSLLISLLFTIIDTLRRKWSVERPVRRIAEATERMIKGDFSMRIPRSAKFATDESFNIVIDSINKMAEELSGVETLRTDFIANVSHEMKTPLAVIKNYAKLLDAPDLSKEQRAEYTKAITDASGRLADMMTNILRLNRLENQQIYPKNEIYDLGEQLCECLLAYESVWEARGIEIEASLDEEITVCADAELLSLVWNNLLSNAFKFTERGGTVAVSLSADAQSAVVQIRDTGCGMTPEVGAHIFEKFYQGDTSHATEGNGLGLALVKRVIDIVEGEISVFSIPGEGTTFTVKIGRIDHAEQQ